MAKIGFRNGRILGLLPPAMIVPFAGSSSPDTDEWLLCDGSAISRTTYSRLFGIIGTTYGSGDGSTTFNVPDMRGRTPAGLDNMGGTSANRITDAQADSLGGSFGTENHTLTTTELPSHDHALYGSDGNYIYQDGATGPSTVNKITPASNTYGTTLKTQATGGGTAHNNVQPSLFLNYLIKT